MSNPQPQLNAVPVEPSLSDLLNLLKKEIFLDLNSHHLATIQSFDPTKQTCSATINYTRTKFLPNEITNQYEPVQFAYPQLIDVPVIVLGGGGYNLTFPVKQGDQCLICFNDRSIDNWFQSGQVGPLNSNRAHSLADGLAIVGLRFATSPLEAYDADRAVLRGPGGSTGVGVGESKIKIFNDTTTLNTILQNILTQLQTLANSVAVNGSPIAPSVAVQLNTLATQLGDLLE